MSDIFTDNLDLDGQFAGRFAIVGVGETDYGADYRASRAPGPDHVPADATTLARRAFERALADSGLALDDIDGVCGSFPYGGPAPAEFAAAVGIRPRHAMAGGGMLPFLPALAAVAAGKCDTMAIVHSLPSRAIGRQYGGHTYEGDGRFSYYYYHPWGWSSQAAHWALMWSSYLHRHGVDEEDLGAVAITLRGNAMRNPNAAMRSPMTLDDYLASPYIVRPMRRFDLCLVNDGAVCVIVTEVDRARDLLRTPVVVAGWGNARVTDSKMHYMVREQLRPQFAAAADDAYGMAGVGVADVDHFEGYDASTVHLVNQLEGYGFVGPGEGLAFWKDGHTAIGGAIPTNTAGGLLSEAYMQGWNLMAEIVRQLRHEAGERQIAGVEVSLFSFATTDSAHPIVFTRGV